MHGVECAAMNVHFDPRRSPSGTPASRAIRVERH